MRGYFSHCKAEDEGGLTPTEDDNAAERKIGRNYESLFKWFDYIYGTAGCFRLRDNDRTCAPDARLLAAASFVRAGSRVADVGADHAYLCVYLAGHGICSRALACEIRPGPARNAEENIRAAGLSGKIEVRMGDGLAPVRRGEADDIVIAGMGGETISQILSPCDWIRDRALRFILQPMSKPELLRKWLLNNGFAMKEELAVKSGTHIYTVICAGYDPAEAARQTALPGIFYCGALCPEEDISRAYMDKQRRRLELQGHALERAGYAGQSRKAFDAAAEIASWKGI